MFKALSLTTCLTAAGLLAQGTQVTAQTGPVREGVRRTGEAAADGTRAVIRGSRNVIGRTGQAARNIVPSTTEAARAQVGRAERNESQSSIGITTDAQVNGAQTGVNAQAGTQGDQGNADLDANQQPLNADGQIQGNLNDSSIANDPNGQDRYESGYRGVDDQNMNADQNANAAGMQQQAGQVDYNGQMYVVRHNSQGREFICVNGCPVYLDSQTSGSQSREAYKMSEDSMQNGAAQGDQRFGGQQGLQDNQRNTYRSQGDNSSVLAPPVPVRTGANVGATASPSLNADTAINADQSGALNDSADIDADADVDLDADSNDQNEDSNADQSENDSEN